MAVVRIQLGPRTNAGLWLIGVEISFVCRDPIRRDITLRRCQLRASLANQLMEVIFELVLNARVPGRRVGLRPEILDTVDSAQRGVIRSSSSSSFLEGAGTPYSLKTACPGMNLPGR